LTVQGDLLAFFGQEIVAHAATFIATLGAAFLFMSSFRRRSDWSYVVQFPTSWLLLSGAIYDLFRMSWYGQLVFAITNYPDCDDKLNVLSAYNKCLVNLTEATLDHRIVFNWPWPYSWYYWSVRQFTSSYTDWHGIAIAFGIGFLLTVLLLFSLEPKGSKAPSSRECDMQGPVRDV
jgi:hypothetical protein